MNPTILNIQKHAGIAGQFEVSATVQYPEESPETVRFVGSVYGGPVVMITSWGENLGARNKFTQTFVTEPERFGEFGTEWVRRFFGGAA